MSSGANPAKPRILIVRLGAMGDVIHTLPAVAALKRSYPESRLTWAIEPRWAPLLAGNPSIDRVAPVSRNTLRGIIQSIGILTAEPYDIAIDFQGLLKSAMVASLARPGEIYGFDARQVREPAAALLYSVRVTSRRTHVVDRNLDLAAAAGAATCEPAFFLPPGEPEGELPPGDFVLASPLGGWRGKQWPLEFYAALAVRIKRELSMPLVLNGPPGADFSAAPQAIAHYSGIAGLIHATRLATVIVGGDSGPLHLAAALGKPGVAVFGPTHPARNGPYGTTVRVLRSPAARATYRRRAAIDPAMLAISPAEVFEELRCALGHPVR